jgi:hypothetical protein
MQAATQWRVLPIPTCSAPLWLRQGTLMWENEQGIQFMFECKSCGGSYPRLGTPSGGRLVVMTIGHPTPSSCLGDGHCHRGNAALCDVWCRVRLDQSQADAVWDCVLHCRRCMFPPNCWIVTALLSAWLGTAAATLFTSSFSVPIVCGTFLNKALCRLMGGHQDFGVIYRLLDRLCGLVVRVPGYRSGSPGSIPGAIRFSEK